MRRIVDLNYRRIRSIRRFLKDQMEWAERYRFEQDMLQDDNLKKEVNLYRLIISELKEMESSDHQ